MRTQFTTELNNLYDRLIQLGNITNEAVHKSTKAYNAKDSELAEEVIAHDAKINQIVMDIEAESYRLIALQQPVSDDLRKIFTVLLASTDLERIADHAVTISRQSIRLADDTREMPQIHELINDMGEKVQLMLKDLLIAFHEKDVPAIKEIAGRDNEIDLLLKQLYHKTAQGMEENTQVVNYGIGHLNIGKSLERIGDYCTNICERLIYLSTGEIVDLNK